VEFTSSTGAATAEHTAVDWAELKARILAGLDVAAEYRRLGLRPAGGVNPETGKMQAHAMGRDDDNPSAFISVRTGVYHAHGEPPETLSFWDFALRHGAFGDWSEMLRFYAARAGVELPRYRKTGKGWIEEARYPYVDRVGDLVFEVIRYRQANGKKTFRQRRPGPKGDWIYDLDGVRRLLYRLPEVAGSDLESPVWIVEGEKDADTLAAFGLIATTGAQGAEAAGRRHWEEGTYTPDLVGRSVRIIPDNDPTGRYFARLVARALHGKASSVRLVELPGLHPKGDVSDWLDLGHSVADLVELGDAAADFEPTEEDPEEANPDRDATAADLVAANAGTRWLWEGWLPVSVLTLLTAEPSTGKTRLGLDLTKRIAQRTTWPDGSPIVLPPDVTSRVLWIAADHQHAELADAPAKFGFDARCLLLNATVGDIYGGTELQTPDQVADLEARIKRLRPALVIIDTVTNTSDLKSQDTSDAKRQYKPLQEIAKRTGVAILCVTHLNVAGKTLGRRADEKTRVTIRLECPDPDGQPNRRKLSVALSRLSVYPPALGVTMGDDGNQYDDKPPTEAGQQVDRTVSPKVQEAVGFLTVRLALGCARVHALRTEAEHREPPISAKSLYAARDILQVEEYEEQGKKWWRLPANGNHEESGHF
jgi:hypothetical protein